MMQGTTKDGIDKSEKGIEIAPLVASRASGTFQRSMSSSASSVASAASSNLQASTTITPPASQKNKRSSATATVGSGRLTAIFCWILCCCSSSEVLTTSTFLTQRPEIVLLIQALGALLFVLLGWYIPRHLIRQASAEIIAKPVPFQTTAAGDVILDSLLNQVEVEPPTIPCTFVLDEFIRCLFL